jgi:hypothetical protein
MTSLLSKVFTHHPHLDACFTTRHGGISQPPFNAFNLAFHVGDKEEDVLENHRILGETLNYDFHTLVHMNQIHSDIVAVVDSAMDFASRPRCDALITNSVEIPLMVMSADCTPILLYDPVNHAIGAVHAGRAGALNGILPKTIAAMETRFKTPLSELQIVLGPSIHGCCYEINDTIANEVKEKGFEDALVYQSEAVFLDVNTILYIQLRAMGIASDQIETASACTACNHNTYFSYRADQQHTGRIAGVIVLRPLPS